MAWGIAGISAAEISALEVDRMRKYWPPRLGLRSKLLLLSLSLLGLPWLGFQYISEMELYLQSGQAQMAASMARALALTLGEKAALFDGSAGRADNSEQLYIYPLPFTPDTGDDTLSDWLDFQQYEWVLREGSANPYQGNQYTSFRGRSAQGDPLQVRLLAGEVDSNLFVYVRVLDRYLQFASESLASEPQVQLEGTDAVVLSVVSSDGIAARYRFTPLVEGAVEFWRAGEDPNAAYGYQLDQQLQGRFTPTADGYEVELQLPLALAERGLVVAVEDIDEVNQSSPSAIVASGDLVHPAARLQRPAQALAELLPEQYIGNYRIQVFDRNKRLLYATDNLPTATGLTVPLPQVDAGGALAWLRTTLVHPLYEQVLGWLDARWEQQQLFNSAAASSQLQSAVTGVPQTGKRLNQDTGLRTLEAAWPILANQDVVGALVVTQNLDSLRTVRNQALALLFDVMLAMLALTITALLLFVGSLSSRLRLLRDQAERSIDVQGRLTKPFIAARTNDEIGDLSRSIANMVERLGRYNQYLENLTARLSHELRTPVTVVRTSLENLRLLRHDDDDDAELYIQRAEDGISRLTLILTNMSEATRLEQLLQGCEKERVVLNELVQACVAQYRQIYPSMQFVSDISAEVVLIQGSAEHLVQMLDKVVANAVEFSPPPGPVRLSCMQEGDEAVLTISNYGPYLDPGMKDRLFDSMVSVRPAGHKGLPHLGLGLHIARLITDFHQGTIYAENLMEAAGVIVVVRMPSYRFPANGRYSS
jgi:two-component system, OmpR family, sensor histidine kinase ChvG